METVSICSAHATNITFSPAGIYITSTIHPPSSHSDVQPSAIHPRHPSSAMRRSSSAFVRRTHSSSISRQAQMLPLTPNIPPPSPPSEFRTPPTPIPGSPNKERVKEWVDIFDGPMRPAVFVPSSPPPPLRPPHRSGTTIAEQIRSFSTVPLVQGTSSQAHTSSPRRSPARSPRAGTSPGHPRPRPETRGRAHSPARTSLRCSPVPPSLLLGSTMVRRLNGSFKPNAFEFVPSPIKFISTSFIPRFFSYPIPFRAFPRGWTQRPRGLDHFNRPDVSRPTHLNHLFLSLTPMSNTARPR
jgi:hypothetical protein